MAKKKVVTTKNSTKAQASAAPKAKRKTVATKKSSSTVQKTATKKPVHFLYDKRNFMLMLGGIGLIALGLLLMSGGAMDDPNEWDSGKIYSFRRITLAPIIILAGFVLEIYAIFKRFPNTQNEVA